MATSGSGSGREDTPVGEWDEAPTIATGIPLDAIADAPEITKPHDLGPVLKEARDAGCRACYSEGQEDAVVALRSLLYEKGTPDSQVEAIIVALRERFVRL